MSKTFVGKVLKAKDLQKTVVVGVEFRRPHPRYKKVVKKTTKLKVDAGNFEVKEGDVVAIVETRPISKDKHFKIKEVIKR